MIEKSYITKSNQASIVIIPEGTSNNMLMTLNSTSQLPVKLTGPNYPTWRTQFLTLLYSYDLRRYINGILIEPPITIKKNDIDVVNLDNKL